MPVITGYYLKPYNSDMGSGWQVWANLDTGFNGYAPGYPDYRMTDAGVLFTCGGVVDEPGPPAESTLLRVRWDAPHSTHDAWEAVVRHARHRWPHIRVKESEPRRIRPEDRPVPPPDVLTVADIARRRGVAESTIRAYHTRGQMPRADGYDRHEHPWWSPYGPIGPWLDGRPAARS